MASPGSESIADATNTETASSHNILTIPLELFERIADEVDGKDLLTLRLVSKETDQKMFRTYLNLHFTERAFLLSSMESLYTLIAIAEHEPFAKSLRRLDLCIEEIPDRDHTVHEARGPVAQPTKLQTFARELQARSSRHWDGIADMQAAITGNDIDLHLLTVAFARLRRWQKLREIRLVDLPFACETPQRYRKLEKLSGQTMIWREKDERLVSLLFDALSMSLLKIESFVVQFDNYHIDFTAMVNTQLHFSNTVTIFSHLKKLHLQIDTLATFPEEGEVNKFVEALGKATLVEDLSLVLDCNYWSDGLPLMFKTMVRSICQCLKAGFFELKFLELQGFDMQYRDLKDMLSSLKKLEWFHFHPKSSDFADRFYHYPIRDDVQDDKGQAVTQSQVDCFLDKFKVQF